MEAVERSELIRKERRLAHRDTIRLTEDASEAAAKSMLMGRMLDESAMEMLDALQASLKGKKRHAGDISSASNASAERQEQATAASSVHLRTT